MGHIFLFFFSCLLICYFIWPLWILYWWDSKFCCLSFRNCWILFWQITYWKISSINLKTVFKLHEDGFTVVINYKTRVVLFVKCCLLEEASIQYSGYLSGSLHTCFSEYLSLSIVWSWEFSLSSQISSSCPLPGLEEFCSISV